MYATVETVKVAQFFKFKINIHLVWEDKLAESYAQIKSKWPV